MWHNLLAICEGPAFEEINIFPASNTDLRDANKTWLQIYPAIMSTLSCFKRRSVTCFPVSGANPSSPNTTSILCEPAFPFKCSKARLTAFFISSPITAAGVVNVVTNPILISAATADDTTKLQNIIAASTFFIFLSSKKT